VTNFVGNSLADWCDENTRIVCEIFADEVLKGNRSSTHLSKTGYKNVIERFKDRTGLTILGSNSRINRISASRIMIFGRD
jgi:hypothetical protein